MRVGGWAVVDGQHALRPLRDLVEAGVGGDRVEPGAQRAALGELRQAAPGPQHRLLQGVLGIVDRAEQAVAVGVELAAVGVGELPEGPFVASARGLEQLPLGCAGSCRRRPHRLPTYPVAIVSIRAAAMSFRPRGGLNTRMPEIRPNSVVHLELHTGDLPAACAFYAELCGWRPQRVDAGGASYLEIGLGGGVGGGVVECATERPLWLPYVEVPGVDAATERARWLGAKVLLEPREGPVGWRSVVSAPAGGQLALWQPKR